MRLLLKIVAAFAVFGLLLLLVLSYMENEHGLETNASEVLRDMETAGTEAVQATENFLETSGIKAGAESLFDKAAALFDGQSEDEPDTTAGPDSSPVPDQSDEETDQSDEETDNSAGVSG